jgi:hypothetical protein
MQANGIEASLWGRSAVLVIPCLLCLEPAVAAVVCPLYFALVVMARQVCWSCFLCRRARRSARCCYVVTKLWLKCSPGHRSPVRSYRAPAPLIRHPCLRPSRFSFIDQAIYRQNETTYVPGQPEQALCVISVTRSSSVAKIEAVHCCRQSVEQFGRRAEFCFVRLGSLRCGRELIEVDGRGTIQQRRSPILVVAKISHFLHRLKG